MYILYFFIFFILFLVAKSTLYLLHENLFGRVSFRLFDISTKTFFFFINAGYGIIVAIGGEW